MLCLVPLLDVSIWAAAWQNQQIVLRPANTQISLCICPVWPESSLSAWRNLGSLANQWAHSELWSDWADGQFLFPSKKWPCYLVPQKQNLDFYVPFPQNCLCSPVPLICLIFRHLFPWKNCPCSPVPQNPWEGLDDVARNGEEAETRNPYNQIQNSKTYNKVSAPLELASHRNIWCMELMK